MFNEWHTVTHKMAYEEYFSKTRLIKFQIQISGVCCCNLILRKPADALDSVAHHILALKKAPLSKDEADHQ
jgi:hypothetical protein